MSATVAVPHRPNPAGAGQMNFYDCQLCGEATVAVHRDDPPGVTPFMLKCRATPGCTGDAFSRFYPPTIPDPAPEPHVEWFRPQTRKGLLEAPKAYHRRDRPAIRDHFDRGGSLMRNGPAALNPGNLT